MADEDFTEETDGETLTPASAAGLISAEGSRARRRLEWAGRFIFGMWGGVWALSAIGFYLALPRGPELWPRTAAIAIVSVVVTIAFVASIVLGVRSSREVHGPAQRSGAWLGWGWLASYGAIAVVNAGLAGRGLSEDTVALLWSGTSLVVIGILVLTTGAHTLDRIGYGIGILLLCGGALAVLVGVPHNYLVLGIAGGAGMIGHAVLAGGRAG